MMRLGISAGSAIAMLLIAPLSDGPAFAATRGHGTARDRAAISAMMVEYADALNAADPGRMVALFDADGVFMEPYNPPWVGREAVRRGYEHVFKTLTMHLDFTVDEIVEMSRDWAFVRAHSIGPVKINATGVMLNEGDQELFVLKRGVDDHWRIARYSFATTDPIRR